MMRRMNRPLRRLTCRGPRLGRDGFSLVEILMVLMILAVGVIPLAVVQHRARKEVTKSDIYTTSLNVAQSQLERMRGLGFGNAAPDSGAVGNIQWVARVTNVSFGLDRIEVTTTYQGDDGPMNMTVAGLVSMR